MEPENPHYVSASHLLSASYPQTGPLRRGGGEVFHWRGEVEWEPWIWDGRQSGEEDACDSLSVTT